ncbi:hypothetical protein GW17_00058070 [Ensete ventricosum]|nr:hypothetical protein GW17_00058070 [Ensete ventricosum]
MHNAHSCSQSFFLVQTQMMLDSVAELQRKMVVCYFYSMVWLVHDPWVFVSLLTRSCAQEKSLREQNKILEMEVSYCYHLFRV